MKVNEVTQDHSEKFEKEFSVIEFAVDEDGKYKAVKSSGLEAKNIALEQAWEFEEEKASKAREQVRKQKKSFIYYHMKKNMMSLRILAGYTGFGLFKTWKHCQYKGGQKLTDEQLKAYCYAFGYSEVNELLKID